jgi:hypothetical protein
MTYLIFLQNKLPEMCLNDNALYQKLKEKTKTWQSKIIDSQMKSVFFCSSDLCKKVVLYGYSDTFC